MDGDDPWWYPGDKDGSSVDMFGGHNSTDDLFELLWKVGGTTGRPASPLSPAAQPPLLPLECMSPPLAAGQYPVVCGQDLDGKQPPSKETNETKGKLPATDDRIPGIKDINTRSYSSEKKKSSRGSRSRKGSSHHLVTHSLTEKRRRCKITERLRTLQQLVPGCEKSNQASTLDQTIQYMKLLQKQLQAMSASRAPPPAVYPVAMPVPPSISAVVPGKFGAMLPHHDDAFCSGAAVPSGTWSLLTAADATGDHAQRSVSLEQQQHPP